MRDGGTSKSNVTETCRLLSPPSPPRVRSMRVQSTTASVLCDHSSAISSIHPLPPERKHQPSGPGFTGSEMRPDPQTVTDCADSESGPLLLPVPHSSVFMRADCSMSASHTAP
uniref:Uncharacterized protein n=1 Tax=Knipowitschia caucasica TaxID=637954 RepID=A0AAV2K9Z2_KNICA